MKAPMSFELFGYELTDADGRVIDQMGRKKVSQLDQEGVVALQDLLAELGTKLVALGKARLKGKK